MRCDKTAVFKNSDAEFSQYRNKDLVFSVTSIGEDEPLNCSESESLRRCIEKHMEEMETKSNLEYTGMSVKIRTQDGRYLADTKVVAEGFRDRGVYDIPNLTRDMYDKFGDVIPCMSELT